MKKEKQKNYPHYRRNKISGETLELAMHLGASPKAIQEALDKQTKPPQIRK